MLTFFSLVVIFICARFIIHGRSYPATSSENILPLELNPQIITLPSYFNSLKKALHISCSDVNLTISIVVSASDVSYYLSFNNACLDMSPFGFLITIPISPISEV